jgi:hypothetical protein
LSQHWGEQTLIHEKELLEKVEEWQNKANRETDPFDKYVSMFIAYNIFYNLYAKRRNPEADLMYNDSKNAIATISLIEVDHLYQSIESDLRLYVTIIPVFREEYWPKLDSPRRIAIAETLKTSMNAKDTRNTIDMLVKWLYKVRCNLVHGEKSYKDDQQRILLEASTRLLDRILRHMISRYEQIYRQNGY